MSSPIKVLHITSHLGGGVGRASSKLTAYNRARSGVEDSFICLEAAKDTRYIDDLKAQGAHILIAPDEARMRRAIEAADIVQLEWWHHPLMAKGLDFIGAIPARWVIWSHISGLHYPAVPPAVARLPHAFLTTTQATLPLLDQSGGNLVAHVSSSGGFDDFPLPQPHQGVRAGYLGSLNPAKLHPDVMEFAESVDRPDFRIDFYGDSSVNPALEQKVRAKGAQSPLRLRGFCERPQNVLPGLDIFIYLLNPAHYGTTENALLEAMACGAVPVVLDNPVESGIVRHGMTGLVAKDRESFAAAVHFLLDHPEARASMSKTCVQTIRRAYSLAAGAQKLADIYRTVMPLDKRTIDFSSAFGKTPADMFLSCLGDYADCFAEGDGERQRARRRTLPFLYEKSKSSVFQFCDVFPGDARLAAWKAMLYSDQAPPESSS